LVEAGEERTFHSGELVRVRVAVRLAEGEHALVVARARRLGQLALRLDVRSDLAERRLGLERALGDPQLQHLARPAQRLTPGAAAIDLLPRHLGTSWKPPSTSRTSHPSAPIDSRSSSARSKLRCTRAASRSSASSTTAGGGSGTSAAIPKSARPRRTCSIAP